MSLTEIRSSSENMQQIYKRAPMLKYGLKKTLHCCFIEITLNHGSSSLFERTPLRDWLYHIFQGFNGSRIKLIT